MDQEDDRKAPDEQPEASAPEAGAEETETGEAAAANVNQEAPADSVEAGAADSDAGESEDRIATLEAEVAELKDQALRAIAEAENTRRRAERDKADGLKYAVASFARDLLTVADNLGRALESTPEGAEKDENLKGFVEGVQMTEKELQSVFSRFEIRRIDAEGERFDHNLHQAMFEVEDTGKPAGTVVQMLQPGYRLHDRLLRPAMVGVAKDKDESIPKSINTEA